MITVCIGDAVPLQPNTSGILNGVLCECVTRPEHVHLVLGLSVDGHRVLVLSPERWIGWVSVLSIIFAQPEHWLTREESL